MIYDAFLFFNEFEILNIRLHELAPVVDKFLVVEANKTFSNKPKASWLQEKKHLFSRWADKMIVVTAEIAETKPVKIETLQRQAIWEALKNHVKDDDIVMMSDADEIPSASAVGIALEHVHEGNVCFIQDVYQYYLNCRVGRNWKGTRMASPKTIRELGSMHNFRYSKPAVTIGNAGWHFGFMGGADRIKLKIQSFCHTELDQPRFTEADKIGVRMEAGGDPFDRWQQTPEIVSLDQMPAYVRDNPHVFASWLTK